MAENLRFKNYITSLARLSDNYGGYSVSDCQAWRKIAEGRYVSGYHKICGNKWYHRFEALKTNDVRDKWAVRDLISGEYTTCATFSECRAWAERMSENLSRYVKEVYQPGMFAYTPNGVHIHIDAVEAGTGGIHGAWYSRTSIPDRPQEKLGDVTSLYLSLETAEAGFADWLRKVSLDSDVLDRVGEDEIRKKYGKLVGRLTSLGLTVSIMEDISGGQIASLFTDVKDAPLVLKGAFVTCSDEAKIRQGVPKNVIEKFSTYSVATAMANACKKACDADFGIGVTGSSEEEVCVAVLMPNSLACGGSVELYEREDRQMYKFDIADAVYRFFMDALGDEEPVPETKAVLVTAYPYAAQSAKFNIPAGLSPEEERRYIEEHFKEIHFGAPKLDYKRTEFDYEELS